jgi:hypothetical protein
MLIAEPTSDEKRVNALGKRDTKSVCGEPQANRVEPPEMPNEVACFNQRVPEIRTNFHFQTMFARLPPVLSINIAFLLRIFRNVTVISASPCSVNSVLWKVHRLQAHGENDSIINSDLLLSKQSSCTPLITF